MNPADIPDRLNKDLDRYLRDQELAERFPETFDEWQDDHVGAVVPADLVKPIQALLCMRATLRDGDYLKPELDALYKACVARWEDL